MSERYKIVEIPATPARTERRLECVICDICGKESGENEEWPDDSGDEMGGCTYIKTRVKLVRTWSPGWNDPDHHMATRFDLCPACFKNKLMPWLAGQGVAMPAEKWESEHAQWKDDAE